jgi:signal transduction histidine kinase
MIGATLLFTDITEIRRLQQQVDLKNRLAAMGEMSAGIAHEFRNSLGAVLGYARLVEKQAAGNEMLRVSAEGIMTEVRNFDAMLGEFLSFARPQRLNKEDCSLGDLVKEALEVLSDEIRRRGARIEVNTETPPPVTVDRTLMRQALVNLVKNALEAVGQGGMIRLQEKGLRGRAELWIEDNGPGITEENRKKIFQPFFTTKEGGTGLGLPITQKTILSHQGSLTIKSDREQETVVIVSLPAAESAA